MLSGLVFDGKSTAEMPSANAIEAMVSLQYSGCGRILTITTHLVLASPLLSGLSRYSRIARVCIKGGFDVGSLKNAFTS